MLRPTILLSLTAFLLAGCGDKTEAEKQEEERVKIRAEKKENARKYYNDLGTKYPEDPRAEQSKAKAKSLEPAK